MKFEDEFENFQDRLAASGRDELLWRLRDSIYCSAYYVETGEIPLRRHRFGNVSWLLSLVGNLLKQRPQGCDFPVAESARFGFLFFGWHDSHFKTLLPMIRELAEREAVLALTIALKPTQIALLEEIDGVRIHSLEGWLRKLAPGILIQLKDAVTAIISARKFRSLPVWTAEERTQFRSRSSRLVEGIFEFLCFRRIWRERAGMLPTKALFVTSESSPVTKALVDEMLRTPGRRVIHMAHGFRSATHQVTRATDFCVFNAVEQDWYASRVSGATKVHAIGIPRLEAIRERVGPPRGRIAGEPFRLLFFSQGTSTDYSTEMRREDLGILGSGKSEGGYVLRLRPHPLESMELLREDLRATQVEVDEWSEGSLEEDLAWCDVAATSSSTALMEAAVTHRICYWTNARADRIAAVEELWDMGVGKLLRTHEEWMEEVAAISTGTAAEPAVVSEEKLRSLRILPGENVPWSQRLGL
jgi:hypothetical protein